eukprot:10907518-Alexandrium_andersonii.AAC.1
MPEGSAHCVGVAAGHSLLQELVRLADLLSGVLLDLWFFLAHCGRACIRSTLCWWLAPLHPLC